MPVSVNGAANAYRQPTIRVSDQNARDEQVLHETQQGRKSEKDRGKAQNELSRVGTKVNIAV